MAVEIPVEFNPKFQNAIKGFDLLKGAAVAFVGAFAVNKIVDGLGSIVSEAADAERGMNRLKTSLKASGDFSEQNVKAFQQLADQISRTTRFTEGATIASAVLGKQFGLNNAQIQEFTEAAANLAEGRGISLEEAMTQLGQTLDGTAGKLASFVPGLASLTEEQLKAGAAAEVVSKQYKDFAQDALASFSGQVDQAVKKFADLRESLGKSIVENQAVVNAIFAFNEALSQLQDLIKENQEVLSNFVKNGVLFLAQAVYIVAGALGNLDGALTTVFLGFEVLYELFRNIADFIKRSLMGQFKAITQIFEGDFRGAATTIKEIFTKSLDTAAESQRRLNNTVENFGKRQGVYRSVQEGAAKFAINVQDGTSALNQSVNAAKKVKIEFDGLENATAKANKAAEARKKNLEEQAKLYNKIHEQVLQIDKDTRNAGENEEETLRKTFAERVKLIRQDLANRKISISEATRIELNSRTQMEQKITDLKKKGAEEAARKQRELDEERQRKYETFVARLKEITQDPLKIFSQRDANGNITGNRLGLSEGAQEGVAAGLGAASTILGGKEGAKRLIGSVASAAGVALLGPAGEALGPIAEVLSQGPDKVREMVREFTKALPELVENVVASIPVVIEELADRMPEIIERLVERAPDIIAALIRALPRVLAKLATMNVKVVAVWLQGAAKFVGKIISGAGQFVGKILSGAVRFVGEILRGAGQFVSKLVKGIGGGAGGALKGVTGGKGVGGILGAISGSKSPLGAIGGAVGGVVGGIFGGGGLFKGGAGAGTTLPNRGGGQVIKLYIGQRELAATMVDINKLGFRTS